MTDDLTDALAALQRVDLSLTGHKWTGEAVQQTDRDNEADAIATILNAAARGDLIPATDARLAGALVVEDIAQQSAKDARDVYSDSRIAKEAVDYMEQLTYSRVRTIADTDALAQVQNMRKMLARALEQNADLTAEVHVLRAERDRLVKGNRDLTAQAIEHMNRAEAAEAKLAALREAGGWAELIFDAIQEAEKAMRKFPQPNYVISKFAEEAGEVVKAAIHCAESRESAENLRGEMKQAIAMLYRLWVEGDQVHGLPPVRAALAAAKGGV